MCGRFTLATAPQALAELFELDEVPDLSPRYNIAPTQDAPVVRLVTSEERGGRPARVLHLLRWGLVPSWAEDPTVGYRMINARAETAARKPAYRAAFRRRRCLVLADGFYEWKTLGRGRKQPHLCRMKDGRPFAFAGLWERWKGPKDERLESCTLLTCQPNELCAEVHDRMPVILAPGDYDRWLDPELQDAAELEALLAPYPAGEMVSFPVSPRVGNARLDDPGCVAPLAEEPDHPDGPLFAHAQKRPGSGEEGPG